MGWFKDKLTLDVDLYDEKRSNMLMAPVVTPILGVKYKDVNTGALKKHGFEVEIKWRERTAGSPQLYLVRNTCTFKMTSSTGPVYQLFFHKQLLIVTKFSCDSTVNCKVY